MNFELTLTGSPQKADIDRVFVWLPLLVYAVDKSVALVFADG
jgi:hypothetical protein